MRHNVSSNARRAGIAVMRLRYFSRSLSRLELIIPEQALNSRMLQLSLFQ